MNIEQLGKINKKMGKEIVKEDLKKNKQVILDYFKSIKSNYKIYQTLTSPLRHYWVVNRR